MKRNIAGIIIIILSVLNILYSIMLVAFFEYSFNYNLLALTGSLISALLIFAIIKQNQAGYIGTIIFYAVQIIGRTLFLNGMSYGIIVYWNQSLNIGSLNTSIVINWSAITFVLLGIIGSWALRKNRNKNVSI